MHKQYCYMVHCQRMLLSWYLVPRLHSDTDTEERAEVARVSSLYGSRCHYQSAYFINKDDNRRKRAIAQESRLSVSVVLDHLAVIDTSMLVPTDWRRLLPVPVSEARQMQEQRLQSL